MQTDCSTTQFNFGVVDGRRVEARFDGGTLTSDAGALLLGRTDKALRLVERLAHCFVDRRNPALIEHSVSTLVGQRLFGLALGYEDLNDHDGLRFDPLFAALAGKLRAHRSDCAPVAGKSTLNRLERSKEAPSRYHKINYDAAAIEALFVDLFIEAHDVAPREIILDLDATDDPLHGEQEGRFFHGYYDCYCYLPLYVFCGRHLLVAKLRKADIDASAGAIEEIARVIARIRVAWPNVRIVLRADSGFAREGLMAWCEANGVDYILGLAGNNTVHRLFDAAADDVCVRRAEAQAPTLRRYAETRYGAKSWRCTRRVAARIEASTMGLDIRYVVTNLKTGSAEWLYDTLYCEGGQAENLIKLHKSQLASDRTSCRSPLANQFRLILHTAAYWLMLTLRDAIPKPQPLANAEFTTLRLRLIKIAARVIETATRVRIAFAASCPQAALFGSIARWFQPAAP